MEPVFNFFNDFCFNTIPNILSFLFSDIEILGFHISPIGILSISGIGLLVGWKLFKLINPLS